ncbi:hypothetical protein N7452_005345 [Penicillium brevicompactum]|uniref:Uncharacterized protein n=1 Tax=Penicillium brevicompactum TaxID=5074 RepID=A0A9W9UF22_PENBR|nr:hypothetical protein N7452_005345 [Penicillium brevicompactum]
MKLGLAITSLFAASATAAKYAAGQDCRTNKGCDQNCIGGKWSVAIVAGDARLVCDPGNLDSVRYAKAFCAPKDGGDDVAAQNKATQAACDTVKGKVCDRRCFVAAKASVEQDVTTEFQQKCSAAAGSSNTPDDDPHPFLGDVLFYPTKGQATSGAYHCDSVFS